MPLTVDDFENLIKTKGAFQKENLFDILSKNVELYPGSESLKAAIKYSSRTFREQSEALLKTALKSSGIQEDLNGKSMRELKQMAGNQLSEYENQNPRANLLTSATEFAQRGQQAVGDAMSKGTLSPMYNL